MTTASETMPPGAGPDEADLRQHDLPPTARLGALTLAMIVAGGVLMAAEYRKNPPLAAPIGLAAAAGAVLVLNVALLARVKTFAWTAFFRVPAGRYSPISSSPESSSSCSSSTTLPRINWSCSAFCCFCSRPMYRSSSPFRWRVGSYRLKPSDGPPNPTGPAAPSGRLDVVEQST